jgi:hypothetical protein
MVPDMERLPSRTMFTSLSCFATSPRDRAEIFGALKLRVGVAASVLTAMGFRQIVLKNGNRYSLLEGHS